jgi:hypothetical protein
MENASKSLFTKTGIELKEKHSDYFSEDGIFVDHRGLTWDNEDMVLFVQTYLLGFCGCGVREKKTSNTYAIIWLICVTTIKYHTATRRICFRLLRWNKCPSIVKSCVQITQQLIHTHPARTLCGIR